MKQLVLACARCNTQLEIAVESLLIAVDGGSSDDLVARLGYICPACDGFVDEPLTPRGLSVLTNNGGDVIDYVWERS